MPSPWISLPVGVAVLLLLVAYALLRYRRTAAAVAYVDQLERVAQARADDFAHLLRLSSGFTGAVDLDELKRTLDSELRTLTGGGEFWVVARLGEWMLLAGEPDEPGGAIPRGLTSKPDAWECFPLVSGGKTVGMLGARQPPGGFSDDQRRMLTTAATLMAAAVRNIQLFNRVRDLSMIDPLTRCLMRQFGIEALTREMRRMRRAHSSLCLAMLDVDRFKELNDSQGHQAGDRALAMVGRVLKDGLRASDIACRYGGDEFMIVLPETTLTGAMRAIENLRRRVSATPVDSPAGLMGVSVSVGITAIEYDEEDPSVAIARADAAMYDAKRSGRNRVAVKTAAHPPRLAAPRAVGESPEPL
jgi:diguanylate cyclase (GGDEF)-like protein